MLQYSKIDKTKLVVSYSLRSGFALASVRGSSPTGGHANIALRDLWNYCFFFSQKSTFRVHRAVKRSHYSNGFCFVHRFQSLCKLRSRSSLHTPLCFHSGSCCVWQITYTCFRYASTCINVSHPPAASYLAAALTPFSNGQKGTPNG